MLCTVSSDRRPPQRVFLSYTTELSRLPDGRSFVAVAEAAVIRAGHAPVHMEHFTAEDAPPAEVCRELVRTCNVFVLIAGFRHGSLVADEPWRSYTELEHATATEAGITRRIFLLGERVTSRAELMGGDRQDDRQEAFRERLRTSGVTVATVHSTDELGLAVFQALAMLAVDRPSTHPLQLISGVGWRSSVGRRSWTALPRVSVAAAASH